MRECNRKTKRKHISRREGERIERGPFLRDGLRLKERDRASIVDVSRLYRSPPLVSTYAFEKADVAQPGSILKNVFS